jgi:hypothetical protein
MNRRAVIGLIGGAIASSLAIPVAAQSSKGDDDPIKRLLMGPMKVTITDPRTGPQQLNLAYVIVGLERDIKRIQQNNQKVTDSLLRQLENVRSPDLEGAAGMTRIKELITVSVLDKMGFDYMDVLITQLFVARR